MIFFDDQANRPPILDFEASGFGAESYPIEVGFVLDTGERFCKLIKPAEEWQYWDGKAEALHQISRTTLEDVGITPVDICHELNERLSGMTLFSDAWVCDDKWLSKLFRAGKTIMDFKLSAIENILTECQYLIWDQTKTRMLKNMSPDQRHRASADAEFIQSVFVETKLLCNKEACAE